MRSGMPEEYYIHFRHLAKDPYTPMGLVYYRNIFLWVYNPENHVLVGCYAHEIEDSGYLTIRNTVAVTADPCAIFDIIGHEYKAGRLLEAEFVDAETGFLDSDYQELQTFLKSVAEEKEVEETEV